MTVEVRNTITQALADGRYLMLDGSNSPMTGDLDMGENDLLNANAIYGGTTVASGLTIAANTQATTTYPISGIVTEGWIDLYPNIPNTLAFAPIEAIRFDPTMTIAPVSSVVLVREAGNYTIGGIFSSLSIITAAGIMTSGSAVAGAGYLFIANMTGRSDTAGWAPPAIRSYDQRGIVEADGAAVGTAVGMWGLLDLGLCRAINSGSMTVTDWITAGNFSGVGLGVVSATAGASVTVTNRYVFRAIDTTLNGDGGTEVITNQWGLCVEPMTSATNNYGIALLGDDADGSAIWFGAGYDAKSWYDGTVLNTVTDLIAASDWDIDCGTDKTVRLIETVWADLKTPVVGGRTGVTNPPTLTKWMDNGAGSFGVYTLAFADQAVIGNEEQVWLVPQVPHDYKNGTDIIAHIHWGIKTAGAVGEFIKWGLEYTWANIDGTFSNTTIIYSDASSAANATTSGDTTLAIDKHYVTLIGTITGTGKEISSVLSCRLFRNSSHGDDDLAQAAFGFDIDFHLEVDTIGSRQAFVK